MSEPSDREKLQILTAIILAGSVASPEDSRQAVARAIEMAKLIIEETNAECSPGSNDPKGGAP